MLEGLSSKLQITMKKLRMKGKLSEKDIKEAMKEVKLALLEADVNFKVVKSFINNVSEKCMNTKISQSLSAAQQVIKIVNDELTELMGGTDSKINISNNSLSIIMLNGLQGAGKTTISAKLALKFKDRKPLLVACDTYRPAAIKQLQVLGKQIDIPVFTMGDKESPVNIAKASVEYAKSNGHKLIILDTAGRLHIDNDLMNELVDIKNEVNPNEVLLVLDAMTGQDAVNVANKFNEKLDVSGIILTKLDGDTRGGAALSIKEVTQCPIKFIGTGEKLKDLEVFYPDRMASRILGMGDVLSLIENLQANIDEKDAKDMVDRVSSKDFNFDDYINMMNQIKKVGSFSKILNMIPGVNSLGIQNDDLIKGEQAIKKYEYIIQSMTIKERKNTKLVSGSSSRKKRIAKGAGTTVQEVNKLIKQIEQMKKFIKDTKTIEGMYKKKGRKFPFIK